MPLVTTAITNNSNTNITLPIPGYNKDRPSLTINALGTYNLFNYLTPDEIWAMQDTLNDLTAQGVFTVITQTQFPFTPVTGLKADSGNPLVGELQLKSGNNITLTQSGASITINATGGGSSVAGGTVTRDLSGNISSITMTNGVIWTITRDVNEVIQSITNGINTWTFTRVGGILVSWSVT